MPRTSLVCVILGLWFAIVGIVFYRDFQRSSYFNKQDLQATSVSKDAKIMYVSCTTKSSPRTLLFVFQSDRIIEFVEKIKTSLWIDRTAGQNKRYANRK